MDLLYLTTAIPFVNAAPHLGHALEFVQTDVLARHARARGRAVRFLTGTDEHAAKNVQAAAAAGEPRRRVRRAQRGRVPRARRRARRLVRRLHPHQRRSAAPAGRRGDLATVRGARRPVPRARTPVGTAPAARSSATTPCPEHDAPLERVEEENWFFRLSRYAERDPRRDRRRPAAHRAAASARNEVLGVPRRRRARPQRVAAARARRRLGHPGARRSRAAHLRVVRRARSTTSARAGVDEWSEDADERTHVIGKGILRFHAVIWPAILLSAGLPLPDELFVHDYVTADGRKIGKSLGNAVDPIELVERYGVDALRWWLLREVPRSARPTSPRTRLVATREPRPRERRRQPRAARRRARGARPVGDDPEPASASRPAPTCVRRVAIDDAIDACSTSRAATECDRRPRSTRVEPLRSRRREPWTLAR